MNHYHFVGTRAYQGEQTLGRLPALLSAQQPCLFPLPHLGAIRLDGEKAGAFLQGQVTCDIRAISPHTMRQGALCNIQGRIIALLDIIKFQAQYWLILPKDMIERTYHTLEKVALLSRVRLSCAADAQLAGVWGTGRGRKPHPR